MRQLRTLIIKFNIDDNSLVNKGTKEIIVRIINPSGSVLYQVSSEKVKTFTYNEKELFFSLKKDILFDNSQQQVRFEYMKKDKFRKGEYNIENLL